MVARLNSLDCEIINDDSRFTSEARQMNDELEKKKNSLISVEMQADDFLKVLLTFCFVNRTHSFISLAHWNQITQTEFDLIDIGEEAPRCKTQS